ncbi:MAG: DNA polymerase Y family protein [Xanthomonadales bacterium]|nr:DNA polymerase Y family protein [Xanthomonadales bacterium]
MLWLGLQFPQLGLDLARQLQAADPALPPHTAARVLVERQGSRCLVVLACPQAREAGLCPGQPLPQAQALLPQVIVIERDPLAEQQALLHLAACAYQYSPQLQLDPPAGLLLEIGGSLRLYRNTTATLLPTLQQRLQQLGFHSVGGLGRTAMAARWRAQLAADGRIHSAFSTQAPGQPRLPALDPVPISALPLPAALQQALLGSGIQQLGALRRLPRHSLRRRFGRQLCELLDRLEGRRAEPGQFWRPAASHQASIELPAPTAQGEGLRFPLRRLLGDLCLALRARDACVPAFQLQFELERDGSEAELGSATRQPPRRPQHSRRPQRQDSTRDQTQVELSIQLLVPSRDPRQLEEIVQQRLEALTLPGRVLSLRLLAPVLQPHQALQGDLFDRRLHEQQDWPALLERLRARLGETALLRLQAQPDHRPEHAATLVPVTLAGTDTSATGAAAAPPLQQQPLWLTDPTEAGPPATTAGTFLERIEGGWWDGEDIRRDYWCLRDADGAQAWVYNDPRQPAQWYLHGWYG